MKTRHWAIAAIVCVCAAAWGLTKMTSVQIVNSTVDSTPIGATTPSTVYSSWVMAGAYTGSTLPGQGAYLQWNYPAGLYGGTDFINGRGLGVGGWSFFNATESGTIGSPVAQIDGSGNVTAASFIGPVTGNVTGNVIGTVTGNVVGTLNGHTFFSVKGGSCTTSSPTSGSTCSATVSWSPALTGSYQAQCAIVNPQGVPTITGQTEAASSVTVTIAAITNAYAGGDATDCTISY